MRTLKSLGPALDQKSDHVQKDSDSEAEQESAPARPKRKKKRNRGRKKKDEAGTETAGPADDKKADDKKADLVPKKMKEKDSKAGEHFYSYIKITILSRGQMNESLKVHY